MISGYRVQRKPSPHSFFRTDVLENSPARSCLLREIYDLFELIALRKQTPVSFPYLAIPQFVFRELEFPVQREKDENNLITIKATDCAGGWVCSC